MDTRWICLAVLVDGGADTEPSYDCDPQPGGLLAI